MKNNPIFRFRQAIHDKFRENEIRIHQLNYLFWECTLRCNLKCLHCGSDCHAASGIKDLPFEDFLKAIQPLKNRFPRDSITVVITGGEPLLRTDLPECGRRLRENGFRWSIVTNGYFYDEMIHAQLLAAGMGAITVSIDGLEESHNWLRSNPKSFRKALHATELIASASRLSYDVVTCVSSRNIGELHLLKELLESKKVKAWRLFTIAPVGRAKRNPELRLTPDQLVNLMEFIVTARKEKKMDVKFSCEAYTGMYEKSVRDSFFFCRAGVNIASVLNDGSIGACPNINRHFIQGNIYENKLLEVWENKYEIMRNRSWARTGECSRCKKFNHCNGGAMHLWDDKTESILNCHYNKINKSD